MCDFLKHQKPIMQEQLLLALLRPSPVLLQEKLGKWAVIARSVPFLFRKIESNSDFHMAHLQMREDPGLLYEVVRC